MRALTHPPLPHRHLHGNASVETLAWPRPIRPLGVRSLGDVKSSAGPRSASTTRARGREASTRTLELERTRFFFASRAPYGFVIGAVGVSSSRIRAFRECLDRGRRWRTRSRFTPPLDAQPLEQAALVARVVAVKHPSRIAYRLPTPDEITVRRKVHHPVDAVFAYDAQHHLRDPPTLPSTSGVSSTACRKPVYRLVEHHPPCAPAPGAAEARCGLPM